ncbi:Short-chain dehydrogenase/reductase aba4 [Fulvia fulva]|uniref:Short-chain dehydrogenase/reductase aba4 n=1 Tax=Passalora fulva TaxID=5499 RepID=A0A9Q8P964_PASFU|nr:Short-chain dehydrogenase/reductase aba4 [Fulvia fulva]KAK4623792.1 Short-chain dehydrogenase/reductase aba4 [Fulvia fulva]KAK4625211.1 Short-chain dehydrogenase/reductase aba4 [Fulvia fulva]UJO17970.1 Short-chain dehydrogenase/reductase aba4 [Fulvia fulva]WPV14728.1 Short-chain dehydrogenase/reductase aba4 [Fulvia fulva]WPV29448.1 Short-chain dehydrogenase/reductase aba4 [Fulvia fulva]
MRVCQIVSTIKQFGQLDGAAKIAGVYDYPTSELWHEQRGIEKWDHVIGVNLTGAANCLHVELEHMASAAASTGRKASQVKIAYYREHRYIASKHGNIGLTKALAKEYGPVGININAVAPGAIDTPMNANVGREVGDKLVAAIPIPRRGTAEETAKLIVFLLSEDASYITGATYTVDGGMTQYDEE